MGNTSGRPARARLPTGTRFDSQIPKDSRDTLGVMLSHTCTSILPNLPVTSMNHRCISADQRSTIVLLQIGHPPSGIVARVRHQSYRHPRVKADDTATFLGRNSMTWRRQWSLPGLHLPDPSVSLKNIHKITESKRDNRSLLPRVRAPASDVPSAQVALERPDGGHGRPPDRRDPACGTRAPMGAEYAFRDPLSSRMGSPSSVLDTLSIMPICPHEPSACRGDVRMIVKPPDELRELVSNMLLARAPMSETRVASLSTWLWRASAAWTPTVSGISKVT